MGKHAATLQLLDTAVQILTDAYPQTVRQVFYQLVSRQVLENCEGSYKKVSRLLSEGRRDGAIAWDWIEDRNRRPCVVPMWASPADFLTKVVPHYRRDTWSNQPNYVECWLEKDALSGIVQDVITPYGVTLCVGKGYDGWSSIRQGAERYKARYAAGQPVHVLYLGDFDPSGEDMFRSLRDRLAELGACPTLRKITLTPHQIATYQLPPAQTKKTDSRRGHFIDEHGDETVELDALPVRALRQVLVYALDDLIDREALDETLALESEERDYLTDRIAL
jgi:hypothetical protein